MAKKAAAWPRVLGHMPGPADGATVICVGGIHGNEPAGVLGLRRVLDVLEDHRESLRGSFLALVGNCGALAEKRRYIDEDLNRIWLPDRLQTIRGGDVSDPSGRGPSHEAEEMRALDLELRAAIEGAADREVYVLDLHTTSARGPAFNVLNDTLPNRAFAATIPAPTVLGLEEEVSGTLLSHLADAYDLQSVCFESGQHDDEAAVDLAEAAVWLVLAEGGVIEAAEWPQVSAGRAAIARAAAGLPKVVDVHYRHHIEPEDGFRMRPGFKGFETVRAGDIVGDDLRGPVRAPQEGLMLMPLYQGQGEDGFFLVRKVRPFWLRLSALLRRWRMGDRLHWLPGIRRHPSQPGVLVVDRRVARLLAIEFFHLMGYVRESTVTGRYVTMCRRAFDT